jgi:Holliday junction resolvase RusA-like endonuclease
VRVIIQYSHPRRLLRVYVHGAPHRRQHREVLRRYREEIARAAEAAGIVGQIAHNVTLSATFVDPTGPDLDNLVMALFQALDGKCGKGPALLRDDRQIVFIEKTGILLP